MARMTVLAQRYEREWVSELVRRGVTVNGETCEERERQRRLAAFKANKLSRGRTGREALKEAARAFERAKEKGYVKLHPERGFVVTRGFDR